ncbi:lytic transglycosylase, partial [Haematobacter genomosp. 1]
DIIIVIGTTEDLQASIALNTYARAELARIVAIRTRLKAAQTQPLSDEQIALAAAQAAERRFMDFRLEDLR